MGALIPAYWPVTSPNWDRLLAGVEAAGLPPNEVIVIVNPNSGPFPLGGIWEPWQTLVSRLRSAGLRAFAYVNLCSKVVNSNCVSGLHQGNKSFYGDHGVKADIDMYVQQLGTSLSGFFLDDTTHTYGVNTDPILLATTHCNSLGYETIHNPGSLSENPVLFNAATISVLREDSRPLLTATPFRLGLPAEKSAILLHSVTGELWRRYFSEAQDSGFKYFYATDLWISIPDYLEDMLNATAATWR